MIHTNAHKQTTCIMIGMICFLTPVLPGSSNEGQNRLFSGTVFSLSIKLP